jgi:hypothetical protein
MLLVSVSQKIEVAFSNVGMETVMILMQVKYISQ